MTNNPRADARPKSLGDACAALSAYINRWVEWVCAGIMAVLILDVGVGIFGRYVIVLPVTWTEELARYLMIWVALLAVSCGVARREHVAVTVLLERLPQVLQRHLRAAIDLLGFAFFAFLAYFGIDMVRQGASQYATIFGMTMWMPFAAVPVSSALACVQLALTGMRDFTLGRTPAAVAGEAR